MFMSAAPAHADLHDQALAELLELGMAAAREVQTRLLAAETADQLGELSLAFNRVTRSVRQTIALQAKLAGARRREAREDAADAERAGEARVRRRKEQVRIAIERAIWTEAEDEDAERLVDELDDILSEEALYDDFAAEAVAAHIARLSAELGVTPPSLAVRAAEGGEGTAPPAEAPGVGWRSSA